MYPFEEMTITDIITHVCSRIGTAVDTFIVCNGKTGLADYMNETQVYWPEWLRWGNGEWGTLGNLAINSLITGVVVVFLLVCIRRISKCIPSSVRDISLKWSFIFVWFLGFLVYDVGMCTGQYISLLTNAPMAILYAFKIFLFDSDVSEIHEAFHESWVYSMFFALVHFFAAIISTLFLIKYFGYNILSRGRMWFASRTCAKTVSETYVFWGFNDQTKNLIESIQKHYTEVGKNDYRIVIVRTGNGNDDDKPEERTGFARIFDFLAMPTSDLEKLENLGCLCTGSCTDLQGINADNKDENIIGKTLRLKNLKKLLGVLTSEKIHMLFLNDEEKGNIHDVALLLNDSTIKTFVKEDPTQKREVIFYCLARFNSVHRVIEDQNPSNQIKVKVVDSSHLNVEILKEKQKGELLPVNYVKIDEDATVSTPFNALVIGFSEVGQDSVRFLYEFGAFVKKGSTDDIAKRSDFHLDVVDKNMSDLAGVFVANAPSIKPSMTFIEHGENPQSLIELHQMDCRSIQFYQKLTGEWNQEPQSGWIQKLNYIVIATEDDELNISLGVRIFKAATRYRKDMERLCILVRAHNDDDGHIRRVADHYNRLWAAYEIAPEDKKGKRIHQSKIKKTDLLNSPVIHIFGLDKEVFTYDNIIADVMEQKARKYADRYAKTTNPDYVIEKSAFDDTFEDIMQLKGECKGYFPTYFGMMLLRRTRSQDMANSMHETTKRILIEQALKRCHLEKFEFSKLTRTPNTTTYIWPRGEKVIDLINRIAITIAQTEHLRWNASHEILGYIPDDEKDEVRYTHNCLKDWEDLSEEVRSYDCNVSDFILGIKFMHD